jgi:hypothetical protein
LELVQRWGGGIHINKGRVGEDRGSKETDRCPLTVSSHRHSAYLSNICRNTSAGFGLRVERVPVAYQRPHPLIANRGNLSFRPCILKQSEQ